jgi:hypothetical protein
MKTQQNQNKSVKITCFLTRNSVYLRSEMKVIKVTKEYFQTEDEKVYFFEPLEQEISVDKIVDANEKLVKESKDAKD